MNKNPQDRREFGAGSGKSQKRVEDRSECIPNAMSEDIFLRPFDWKGKLTDGLNALVPGSRNAVIADDDFRRHLGISEAKWRKLKGLQEFKKYQLLVKGSVYWCQPETGKRLRARIELSDEVL